MAQISRVRDEENYAVAQGNGEGSSGTTVSSLSNTFTLKCCRTSHKLKWGWSMWR